MDYNASFLALLDALNPAQQRAVEQIEGPVLVVAGPGTGKTHVLAARIGNILLKTDARPQNILCLTFTDAGVNAMRKRLLSMIGPDAHRVPIFTFHAFCNRIIQENLEYFGRNDLEPVTELERIELVRQLIDKQSTEHPLKAGRKDIYFYEKQLRNLFSIMKKEGWTPGHVLKTIRSFEEQLPHNPDYIYQKTSKYGKKGDLKASKIKDIQEKMQRLAAAADLYPKYQHAMQRAGRYEYEDMILWVLRAFEQHENLLRNYQERYQYFLVDEYQDTNGAQNRLLHQLLDYWPDPNVFIVGDDDQSIFEFQGARLQNLLDFYQTHQAQLQTIVLEQNYRSPQALLDAAQTLIEHNEIRAVKALGDQGVSKHLKAQTQENHPPQILVYPNRLQESAGILANIEQLLAAGTPPAEIAVLYAKHKQAAQLIPLLEKKGIPYETKRPVNILDLPLVQQFRELLRYILEESTRPFSGEPRLLRLLHAPWWNIPSLQLALLAASLSLDKKNTPLPSLRVKMSQSADPNILTASKLLESWISDLPNNALPAFLERLYTQSGLLQWALNQADKVWWVQVFSSLMDFIRSETDRNPRCTLDRVLFLLDSMDDNQLPLSIQQNVRTGAGIQLLTAHAAKGLEFEHVFLLDCTADFWEPSARAGGNQFVLPETLTLSGEEDALEARRRLFYVAATRAKKQLNISYAQSDQHGKPLRQARFTDELGLTPQNSQVTTAQMLETQILLAQESFKPFISLPESSVLDQLLDGFTLSITALNRYLRCPLAFYYQDVLQVPESVSESAVYGKAIHSALQQFFLKMKTAPPNEHPGEEPLLQYFKEDMEQHQGYFSVHGYTQRLSIGRENLRRYYIEQVPYWRRRAVVERRIERCEWNGIPLTGVLDKIEWLDNGQIRIVDYKTGTPDPKKTAPPSENNPLGGDYWRQLAFYMILLNQSRQFPETASTGLISWLDTDKRGVFPQDERHFSPDDIRWMEKTIQETYARIQARDFNEGCGKADCPWCNMHQWSTLSPFSGVEEESLDDNSV